MRGEIFVKALRTSRPFRPDLIALMIAKKMGMDPSQEEDFSYYIFKHVTKLFGKKTTRTIGVSVQIRTENLEEAFNKAKSLDLGTSVGFIHVDVIPFHESLFDLESEYNTLKARYDALYEKTYFAPIDEGHPSMSQNPSED